MAKHIASNSSRNAIGFGSKAGSLLEALPGEALLGEAVVIEAVIVEALFIGLGSASGVLPLTAAAFLAFAATRCS